MRVDAYRAVLTGLAVFSGGIYAALDWQRYDSYASAGYDVGIFDQAIRHYARFQAPVSSLKGVGFSLLGDHFSPILAILAPLFWIWPDTRMLGFVLGLLIAASAFPVYAFCERRLGPGLALVTAAAYLFWWPLQGIVQSDFHEIAFAVPLVAWLIDSLDRGRRGAVVAICLVLLLVREDMGFLLCMVAIILVTQRQFRLAGALAVVGIAAFEVITKLIIPGFAPDGTWQYWAYPALGGDLQSALAHIVVHPLGHGQAARLGIRETRAARVPVPPADAARARVALRASGHPDPGRAAAQRSPVPVDDQLPVQRHPRADHRARHGRHAREDRASHDGGREDLARRGDLPVLADRVGGTAVASNLYPLRYLFVGQDGSAPARIRAAAEIVGRIPPHVCVEADDRLIPHLIGRDYLVPPNGSESLASWLAVDTSQHNTGGGAEITPQARLAAARGDGFVLVWSGGPMRLLHRAGPSSPICRQVD